MKVDLLAGGNPYGTGVHFARGLADALERKGIQVRRFWIDDGYFYSAMRDILNDPPDWTCSFTDISFQKEFMKLGIGDFWHIPHLSWLVDPPIYFLHLMQGHFSSIACVDANDCAFVNNLPFPSCFIPHAADIKHFTPVKKDRPYEAVFFGTCIDYEALYLSWPHSERELLLTAAERVLSPAGESILHVLIELGVSPFDLPRYHGEVDQYIRGKDRVEMIRTFSTPIHIWGDGPWEKYLPQHHIHSPICFEATLQIMKQSRIVLNSSPRFKQGGHERIFYAALCGAAVYTGENRYLSHHFPEVFTYQFGNWECPSFENWQEKASHGQERAFSAHTWDHRAHLLLNQFKSL